MAQERKVVTVLFCDLVGFTSRAEEMDPEDVAALLAPYQARLKSELERYGGTVEKFIGDAVMALFGAPISHEDDPERAVRAALAIRDFAREEGIELRIGVTTGEALVSLEARPERGETLATGDVINTAARLQTAAPVNGILVSEKTHDATRDAIEYVESRPVEAKGKAKPVAVWEARQARSRIGLDRLHGTPFVGRGRELDLLEDALAGARAERQPQLVTLVGVPGMGKSRLVYELSLVVDRDPELISWRQGRCLPYGDGVAFWALGEIVKAHAGILDTDTAEQAESKLREAAPEEWVQAHLRPLVGLSVDGVVRDRREEAFAAWRRFLEGIAAQRPLVLVFEDLHWADESLLDFVDHLVDWAGGVALLVVCTARPELLERRTGWGGGKTNALTLSLSPLADDETARLIGGLVGQAVMPAETQSALLARAGGNPLYAEQFARMLGERATAELQLPETVQGIIAARIDVLEHAQKALLQDAAVVGKVFWPGALTAISGVDTKAAETSLHGLERRGFVRRERDTSIEGDTEYAFLHVLLREVAYGQIPRAERSEKHCRAAEWIESFGRTEDHADLLAHHYASALELARAAGQETGVLEERTRRSLVSAADRSLSLGAFGRAAQLFGDALELWPDDDERPYVLLRRGRSLRFSAEIGDEVVRQARDGLLQLGGAANAAEAELLLADLAQIRGDYKAADLGTQRAAKLVSEIAPSPAQASIVSQIARFRMLAGAPAEAVILADKALVAAELFDLSQVRASALNTRGTARVHLGDHAGVADVEESLALSLEINSVFDILRGYTNLGSVLGDIGDPRRAHEVTLEGLREAERLGASALTRWGRGNVANHCLAFGEWEEALRLAEEFIAEVEVRGPHALEFVCRRVRGEIRFARDDADGAVEDAVRVIELLRDGDPVQVAAASAFLARLFLDLGRLDEAAVAYDEALRTAVEAESVDGLATTDLAATARALGRADELLLEIERVAQGRPRSPWLDAVVLYASGDYAAAADAYQELEDRFREAYVRLTAAQELLRDGLRAEANEQLQRSLAFWRSVGATRYLSQGEALLAAAS